MSLARCFYRASPFFLTEAIHLHGIKKLSVNYLDQLVEPSPRDVPASCPEVLDSFRQNAPSGFSDGELLDALLDQLSLRICFTDAHGRVLRCNHAAARAAGFSDPAGLVGQLSSLLLSSERVEQVLSDAEHVLCTGEPVAPKEARQTISPAREEWVRTRTLPHRDARGNVVGILRIEEDISAAKQSEETLAALQRQLSENSRSTGMAEVATGVLHNVGNVLNSINVSATLLAEAAKHSRLENLAKAAALLREHRAHLGDYLTHDPKGHLLPEYLAGLTEHLLAEHENQRRELEQLTHYIEHIKEIVAMQQNYARVAGALESLPPAELMEDALRINQAAFVRHRVAVRRAFDDVPRVLVDRHKVLQILVNLLNNAKYALDAARTDGRQVVLGLRTTSGACVEFSVSDNGAGIAPEHLHRIFQRGFTTRKDGHGFGLHSGATAARDMGGELRVQSDGPGKGATFTLSLPAAGESAGRTASVSP